MDKKPAPTKKELKRQVVTEKAFQVHNYHFASMAAETLNKERFLGSGFVITIHAMNGKELLGPVAIRDGFSPFTIESLQREFRDSYELATLFKPKGLK